MGICLNGVLGAGGGNSNWILRDTGIFGKLSCYKTRSLREGWFGHYILRFSLFLSLVLSSLHFSSDATQTTA